MALSKNFIKKLARILVIMLIIFGFIAIFAIGFLTGWILK